MLSTSLGNLIYRGTYLDIPDLATEFTKSPPLNCPSLIQWSATPINRAHVSYRSAHRCIHQQILSPAGRGGQTRDIVCQGNPWLLLSLFCPKLWGSLCTRGHDPNCRILHGQQRDNNSEGGGWIFPFLLQVDTIEGLDLFQTQSHFGSLVYRSRVKKLGHGNLGDNIQGYPGLQFLPYVDMLIDRDNSSVGKQTNKNSCLLSICPS